MRIRARRRCTGSVTRRSAPATPSAHIRIRRSIATYPPVTQRHAANAQRDAASLTRIAHAVFLDACGLGGFTTRLRPGHPPAARNSDCGTGPAEGPARQWRRRRVTRLHSPGEVDDNYDDMSGESDRAPHCAHPPSTHRQSAPKPAGAEKLAASSPSTCRSYCVVRTRRTRYLIKPTHL